MLDILLLILLAGVAWLSARAGVWRSAATLAAMLCAGLASMNFFEPLANLLDGQSAAPTVWSDAIALMAVFACVAALLRWLCDRLAPETVEVHPVVERAGRWLCGAACGLVAIAFLLTTLHTMPLPENYRKSFPPEAGRRTGIVTSLDLDYRWLGFVQYVSEKPFRRSGQPRVFDGPRYRAGDTLDRWPSFPIRYATRHRRLRGE